MNQLSGKLLKLITYAQENNRVIDVSTMNAKVIGYKTIKIPGNNNSRKKVPGISIVSTNYEAFKNAIEILGPQYNHFADIYYRMHVNITPFNYFINDVWIKIMEYVDIKTMASILFTCKNIAKIFHCAEFTFVLKTLLQKEIGVPIHDKCKNIWKMLINGGFYNNIFIDDTGISYSTFDNDQTNTHIINPALCDKLFEYDSQLLLLKDGTLFTDNNMAISTPPDIIQVCYSKQYGYPYIAVLTKDGRVFIACDIDNFPKCKFKSINRFKNIVQICAAKSTLIALDKNGDIFGYRPNKLPKYTQYSNISDIKDAVNIHFIFAINDLIFLINKSGKVFYINIITYRVKEIPHIHPVIQISYSKTKYMLLDNTGTVYIFELSKLKMKAISANAIQIKTQYSDNQYYNFIITTNSISVFNENFSDSTTYQHNMYD